MLIFSDAENHSPKNLGHAAARHHARSRWDAGSDALRFPHTKQYDLALKG
jgi:hypothetical protein